MIFTQNLLSKFISDFAKIGHQSFTKENMALGMEMESIKTHPKILDYLLVNFLILKKYK